MLPELVAGMVGTTLLKMLEPLARRALGGPPVFAPPEMAEQLFRRPQLGGLMSWTYGPLLPVALSPTLRVPLPGVGRGAVLGLAVYLIERVALPLTGATPAFREWKPAERRWLLLRDLAFGLTCASVVSSLRFRPRERG